MHKIIIMIVKKDFANKISNVKEKCAVVFKEAIIHYPTDEKALKQINKDISNFHSAVALQYMDKTLNLTLQQKVKMLNSLMSDIVILHGLNK